MSAKVLIVPDKFKGTLSATAAAQAIRRGWLAARPEDQVEVLPMSDGGEGFGEALGGALGARKRMVCTLDAAYRPVHAQWWWQAASRTAVVESSNVIGLAMLPPGRFHPFQLDTFGLGKVLRAVQKAGAERCLIGIGGSATNDGGFGLGRALGWKLLDAAETELTEWWQLSRLAEVRPPGSFPHLEVTVAVDVRNPLLGANGCTRVYGPQKGMRHKDFPLADLCLGRLREVMRRHLGRDDAKRPGAGAAGGLGFGLMAFARAKARSGFDLFAEHARLAQRIRSADLVITGEGALDRQTFMGKGVGELARRCRQSGVPCLALAGVIAEAGQAGKHFVEAHSLTEIASAPQARREAGKHLEGLARRVAARWRLPG